ncbi:MAG: tetratricopeptide repeat protein, partial [Thermoanaerobaculaceae bacterium]|nr:tetratricopeptide repeat protein [Thermoanaerobaculaceae bacterium]
AYTRTRLAPAEELFLRARQEDPSFWPAYVYLAQIAGSSSRFREGREILQQCRSILTEPDGAEVAILEVAEALLAEDLQRLLEALERARRWFPDSGELLYRTAWTYRSIGRPERAIPLLEELIRSGWQKDWSPTFEQLAMNRLLKGDWEGALATAQEGEARFPERFTYPFVAACALQWGGRSAAAREALARAIRKRLDFGTSDLLVTHETAQWWASLLRWPEEVERQWTAMLEEADRRLASSPRQPDLLLAKGTALNGLGRASEALPILESFRGDSSSEPYRLLALARSRLATGDRRGGVEALQAVAEIWRNRKAPALGRLAYNLGCAWCVAGDAEEALAWFLRARDQYGLDRLDLELDPELDLLRTKGLLVQLSRR